MPSIFDFLPPATLGEISSLLKGFGFDSGIPESPISALLSELLNYRAVFNLSGVNDETECIKKHIYESALLAGLIGPNYAGNAADLGTGNGFPGLALAAFYPASRFTLFEAGEKRAAFLENAIAAMKVSNVEVQNVYIEPKDKSFKSSFELITHRAFAKPEKVAQIVSTIGKPGHFLAGFGLTAMTELLKPAYGYCLKGKIEFVSHSGKKEVAYLLVNTPE